MPASVGIDLIEIERIERALERRPRLAERLFAPGELAYANQRARPGRHLAARFAAKEAVIKALASSTGLAGARPAPREIEIEAGEPPTVRLHGGAAEAAAGAELSVSLTHSRESAAAIALVTPAA